MQYTKPFKELTKDDAEIAGGKGASLGEMLNAGIPVPDGFVVLAGTFDTFLKETDLVQEIEAILDKVNHETVHTVERASESIQSLILSREMPVDIQKEIVEEFAKLDAEYVAVRSSATAEDGTEHAWAGQLDSFLNTTESDLIEKVRKCWASLFTPRAIFYRFEKGLHATHISVAVVVQKMVNSEKSGIAFSVHPVTEDYNQLIIEAGFGLGEAIVSGSVTPDSYVVEKEPRRILDVNVSDQGRALYRVEGGGSEWKTLDAPVSASQVLSETHIQELSEIILRIENHYGFPCDIEWAFEDGVFYIVQSRPITTLTKKEAKQFFEKAYTRNFSIIMQELWFYANTESLKEQLSLQEYLYYPPYAYFMRDGVEEVWENVKANEWLLAKLSEKISEDPSFFETVYGRYQETLAKVKPWWSRDLNSLEELEEYISLLQEGINDFVIIYGSLMIENLPEEWKKQAEDFREKDVFFAESNKTLTKALQTIYPDFGHFSVYITQDELQKKSSLEEMEKRDSGFGFIPGIFKEDCSFSQYRSAHPDFQFIVETPESEDFLKGQAAYPGIQQGRVKIVKRLDQAEVLQEGEIIVSPMTTPDFAPATKKAAALITDEGGVTCHAAIIAREMKKPCIIGTKFATQVLQDGDLVEVDAESGVVRILEKAAGNETMSDNDSLQG